MAESKSRLVIEISSDNARKNAEALDSALKGVDKSGDTASKSVKSFGDTANKSTQSVDVLATSAKKLAVIMGGYVTISEAINKSDMYTGFQNRLKLVTKGQTELNQAMNDTFKIAQVTRQSWESAAQVYQGFANNAKTLGLNMQQTARLTETVSKAVAISGSSTASAEAALVQFNQALSSGTLRGEELNSVMEQAPGLAKAIAEGMGITVGQLRTVAATGAITSEALVKALDKAKGSVDNLFSKTDSTIGQSFTVLNNEVTKFVGEAGNASGSARALADGIQLIANNFGTFASLGIATLMGLITTQIVKQTISMAGSIVAWNTETRAVLANNAAKMTALTLGRSLIGIIGGPVGLGITVAATAAAYLLMSDNTKKANEKLAEQTQVTNKTKGELLALQGVQKKGAISDLKESFEGQNKALKEAGSMFNSHIIDLQNEYKFSQKVVDISNQVRLGTMSQSDAIKELNKLNFIQPEQLRQLQKDNELYEEKRGLASAAAQALDYFGIKTELAGNKSQNATALVDANSDALDRNAQAANDAAKAQKTFFDKLNTETQEAQLKLGLLGAGYSKEVADKVAELQKAKQAVAPKGTTAILTNEDIQSIVKATSITDALKDKEDAITKAKREQNKEAEKQLKTLQLSAQVQANAVKYNFSGLESKYGLPSGLLSSTHAIETGNTGKTNQVNAQSGAVGGFQMLSGTAKQYGVTDRTNLAQSAEGAAKYFQYLLKLFNGNLEKAVRAYHAGEGNVQRGTGMGKYNNDYWKKTQGYLGGMSGYSGSEKDFSSSLGDQIKLIQKSQEETQKLKAQYDTADVARQKEHIKRISNLNRLGLTDQAKQEQLNYEAQTQLSKLQFDQQVNGWAWVGEQRIAKDADVKKAIIDASTELTEQQKLISKRSIDEQAAYEIETFRKTQALKIQDLQTKINQQIGQAQSESIEAQAKVRGVMSPNALATWQLQNQYGGELSTAFDDHDKSVRDIGKQDKSGNYEIADAQERHKLLLQADEAYEAQKFAIAQKYANQAEELKVTQTQSQLQLYSQLTSQASEVWGSMTDMVKQARGENSKEYKAMFLAQKAMAIGQQIINTELAAGATTAQTGIFGIPAATAIRAMGYASVGLIAAQTIAGFSSGGYTGDGGVFEPAGVVHKGEVVFSQADVARLGGVSTVEGIRKGIKGYSDGGVVGGSASIASQLNDSSQQQGNVNIEVNVTDSSVSTSGASTDNQKQLGQMIGNTVRAIIRQEQRQGGLLSK